jgi:hypothetical protein
VIYRERWMDRRETSSMALAFS